jgi:MoaA/NifB/PqqE/SkfB family radical SAM enzyme
MPQIYPNVPAILPPVVPAGYRLEVRDWGFHESCVGETVEIDGERINKLLTMDVNFVRDDFAKAVNEAIKKYGVDSKEVQKAFMGNYPCVHACDGCFNKAHIMNPLITHEEVLKVIDQAIPLGLRSIKFLGPGELLANPKLFWILDELAKRGIILGLFTKAAFLGSDALAQRYHKMSAEALTRRLVSDYDNINYLVGYRSSDPDVENRLVPVNVPELRRRNLLEERRFNYLSTRNRAVELLCELGVNGHFKDQRMALICSPVVPENVGQAFDLYEWGTERNMPVYLPTTMVSGRGHGREEEAREEQFENDYIDLAVRVYTWSIKRGVITLEQFERDGVHPYMNSPCNQLTFGLYFNYDGQVWRCPGNDTPDFRVHSNVRDTPLKEIWMASKNYAVQERNNRCVKDRVSVPERYYEEVPRRVLAALH